MITIQKIIDKINDLLVEKYPQHTFYIEKAPQGFERPSFYIEFVPSAPSTSINKFTTQEDVSIQIIYFANVDDYYLTSNQEMLAVSEEVRSIFKKGYIKVDDRAIKVSNLDTEIRDNEILIMVSFSYFEDKPQDSENYETMQEINIK